MTAEAGGEHDALHGCGTAVEQMISVPVVDPCAVALSTSAAEWNMFFLNGVLHSSGTRTLGAEGGQGCARRPEMAAKAWHRLS